MIVHPLKSIFELTNNKKLRGHPYKINKQYTNRGVSSSGLG